MDRIDTPSKAVDLFGAGKHGFKDGDLGLGIPPTALNAKLFNALQEELMAVIEGAGLTPNGAVLNQLNQAIQIMIASAVSQDFKSSVRVATTANIANLTGGAPSTLDGVSLAVGNRILVKDQGTTSQNGLYVVVTVGGGANGTWARATDADGAGELSGGSLVMVEEGALWADSLWAVSTDGAITIGTTGITFIRIGTSATKQIQPITASVAGNALTLTLNPTTLDFRSNSLNNGTVNTRTVTTPITLTISSGSTLGTANGRAARIVLIAIDNAGTVELAAVNLAGGVNLDEATLMSTTAEGGAGAADSANVVYSQVARANVPFRVVGYIELTQAAAGTWATAPSTIQGCGGQALASLQSIGFGQTWQNMTASRALGTTYYNETSRPIMVSWVFNISSGSQTLTINGAIAAVVNPNGGLALLQGIVPPFGSYSASVSGSNTLNACYELR